MTTSPSRPRLLIADDDAFVRTALHLQLRSTFEIIGGACDADEAIAMAEDHEPDVAIIDVHMPCGGGVRATREILARLPGVSIIALSSDDGDPVVQAMLRAGAVKFIHKGAAPPVSAGGLAGAKELAARVEVDVDVDADEDDDAAPIAD